MNIEMKSADVVAAYKGEGLKARVRDLGLKFRICDVKRSTHRAQVEKIATQLGLTDALGRLGGQWNQDHEFIGYKPGSIRRI